MRRKWGIICTFFIIICINLWNVQQKPKIVSCITTMDTAYLTVLARGSCLEDKETVAQEIIESCRKNAFENIVLVSDKAEYPRSLYISVYKNEKQLKEGKEWMSIRYIPRDEADDCDITVALERYEMFIDGRLVKK